MGKVGLTFVLYGIRETNTSRELGSIRRILSAESVSLQMNVTIDITVEQSGAFLSHFGNKQWGYIARLMRLHTRQADRLRNNSDIATK